MKFSTGREALILLLVIQFSAHAHVNANTREGKKCHSERKLCSVRCKPRNTYIINATLYVPRLCQSETKIDAPCSTDKGCTLDDPPRICTTEKSRQIACKEGCSEELVLTQECHNRDECADLAQGGCAARGEEVVYLNTSSCVPCEDILTNVTLRPTASSEEMESPIFRKWRLVLPFSDDKPSVRNLRCFAGFFREQECNGVSEVCSMTTRTFDSVLCLMKVCNQCARISLFGVSRELDRYCRYLRRESCRRVGGFGMRRFDGRVRGIRDSRLRLVRTVENGPDKDYDDYGVCIDGCRRSVLGCGMKKSICQKAGDECLLVKREPALCKGQKGRVCGEQKVKDVAKVVVQKCQRRYCERTVCK